MPRNRPLRWVLVALGATLATVVISERRWVMGGLILAIAVTRALMLLNGPGRRHAAGVADRRLARPRGAQVAAMRQIAVGATTRKYLLHVPPGASPGRRPLVVVLHGGFGSAQQAQRSYRWDSLADREGFVVAYPNGVRRAWNAGTCCGPASRQGIDDVAFIDALVRALEGSGEIDPERVYATGMSNGAMMAYRLACDLPGRFAAIGPVAGTMTVHGARASATSVCHIHGLADHNVPFHGGVGRSVARDSRASVPSVIANWRSIDGCGPAFVSQDRSVRTETAVAGDGRAVTLITVAGAGHQWPGSVARTPRRGRSVLIDPPSTALDATATLWRFFKDHPRPAVG